jgi:hypothetical protein
MELVIPRRVASGVVSLQVPVSAIIIRGRQGYSRYRLCDSNLVRSTTPPVCVSRAL